MAYRINVFASDFVERERAKKGSYSSYYRLISTSEGGYRSCQGGISISSLNILTRWVSLMSGSFSFTMSSAARRMLASSHRVADYYRQHLVDVSDGIVPACGHCLDPILNTEAGLNSPALLVLQRNPFCKASLASEYISCSWLRRCTGSEIGSVSFASFFL
jgi:hypothetical protein